MNTDCALKTICCACYPAVSVPGLIVCLVSRAGRNCNPSHNNSAVGAAACRLHYTRLTEAGSPAPEKTIERPNCWLASIPTLRTQRVAAPGGTVSWPGSGPAPLLSQTNSQAVCLSSPQIRKKIQFSTWPGAVRLGHGALCKSNAKL